MDYFRATTVKIVLVDQSQPQNHSSFMVFSTDFRFTWVQVKLIVIRPMGLIY